ncbi:hypothetical protein ACJ72_00990 [Emergomyces africanus]|uniref:Uncharacterized protein n=1 Tax=Emergomyces africanus TaxID=1955775 RepID=A0A1B7P6F9_9EURO|nr:hypothetical protein ACJ72_00990 [Emergomyces africanus]
MAFEVAFEVGSGEHDVRNDQYSALHDSARHSIQPPNWYSEWHLASMALIAVTVLRIIKNTDRNSITVEDHHDTMNQKIVS